MFLFLKIFSMKCVICTRFLSSCHSLTSKRSTALDIHCVRQLLTFVAKCLHQAKLKYAGILKEKLNLFSGKMLFVRGKYFSFPSATKIHQIINFWLCLKISKEPPETQNFGTPLCMRTENLCRVLDTLM